jgi:hypothetical protein
MVKFVFVMALVAILALVAVPVLGATWDLAADFTTLANPMGAWQVGDGAQGWGPYHTINGYGAKYNSVFAGQSAAFQTWAYSGNYVWGECIKNTGAAGLSDYGAVYDAGEVGLFQGCNDVWGWAKHANSVLWTADANYDSITVNAKFSQIFAPTAGYLSGCTANVDVRFYDPTSQVSTDLLVDTISGYRGNPTTGYSDAIGTHNTTTWSGTTLNNIVAGQVIEFRVWEPTHTDKNQTAISVTINSADVPEPGSMLALGSGLAGLLGFAIRRRRA